MRGTVRLLSFFALVATLASASLTAATITVTSKSDTSANDGVGTLREAIVAANTHVASGALPTECVASSLPASI